MKCRFSDDRICLECGRPLKGLDDIPLEWIRRNCTVSTAPRQSFPCVHRSGPPESVICRECSHRAAVLLVYACDIHGKCSDHATGKRIRGIRPVSCELCDDREATSKGEER